MKKIAIDNKIIDYALIKEAAKTISRGGIVALPTETVYGLGGLAGRHDTEKKLYALKNRPKDKPFSYALGDPEKAISDYLDTLPPFGYRLIEKFWPGPLTIIYYSTKDKKIGIRVPAHAITNQILQEVDAAVYLPSANISGEKEAVSADEVESIFDGKLDLIVDGGECVQAKPSTVVDLTERPFKVLREGSVSEEDIARTFVKKRILFICTGNTCRSPMAQFLLTKYLREISPYFDERFEIISRGTSMVSGTGIAPYTLNILKEEEGVDAKLFYSRRVDHYALLSSDLIFTMEARQAQYLLGYEPKIEGKVFHLNKFLPSDLEKDISDPIGADKKTYDEMYSLIKKAVLELREWL